MKFKEQPLQSFRLRNFKAVRDSGPIRFTPLTVFIGNNGSGKSSLIEGLETFQSIVTDGLDEAMNRWRGFEFVWNSFNAREAVAREEAKRRPTKTASEIYLQHPLRFDLKLSLQEAAMEVAALPGANEVFFQHEHGKRAVLPGVDRATGKRHLYELIRSADGAITQRTGGEDQEWDVDDRMGAAQSILSHLMMPPAQEWQFLSLQPETMGEPRSTRRTGGGLKLRKDGANIADYLNEILEIDPQGLAGIIETLSYVLPYATDVQSVLTSELGRQRYLQLTEGEIKIPGWLLSTGTLRVLAILAVLRHPEPPPLVCIEEIENGLDPRTVRLIMEEIEYATSSGRTQVLATTHSPYLLNRVDVSSVVVVERDSDQQPVFSRHDASTLGTWADEYRTGDLYLKGQLKGRRAKKAR